MSAIAVSSPQRYDGDHVEVTSTEFGRDHQARTTLSKTASPAHTLAFVVEVAMR